MERLTKRLPSGVADYAVNMAKLMPHEKSAYRQKCVEALAAYEDTGLEPEEIIAVAGLASANCARTADAVDKLLSDDAELDAYHALGTVEELSALVKARNEGRDCCECRRELESRDTYPCNYCLRNEVMFADNYEEEAAQGAEG